MKSSIARGLLCLGLFSVFPTWTAQAADELFLGSVAMDAPEAMARRLVPLTRYLSDKTGYRVTFRASPNLGSAVYDLGSGFTQIAYLTPVAYVR